MLPIKLEVERDMKLGDRLRKRTPSLLGHDGRVSIYCCSTQEVQILRQSTQFRHAPKQWKICQNYQ